MRDDDNGKIICKWEDHWERHLYMGISWERSSANGKIIGTNHGNSWETRYLHPSHFMEIQPQWTTLNLKMD